MTWEYKTIWIEVFKSWASGTGGYDVERFDAEMNSLGLRGWELVTIFDTNISHGESRFVVAAFKRARETTA